MTCRAYFSFYILLSLLLNILYINNEKVFFFKRIISLCAQEYLGMACLGKYRDINVMQGATHARLAGCIVRFSQEMRCVSFILDFPLCDSRAFSIQFNFFLFC